MIFGAVGVQGAGKTYRLMLIVSSILQQPAGPESWQLLILDVNHEWPGEPIRNAKLPAGTFGAVTTPEGARRGLAGGARAVIVRPPQGQVGDPKRARELADALGWVAVHHEHPVMLVLPEVHRYAEEGRPLPKHLRIIMHQARHTRTGLLFDTQHFQDVKKEILREARVIFIHAQTHHTSLQRIREYGGDQLAKPPRAGGPWEGLIPEATRRMRDGEPGWHVRWTPGPRSSYSSDDLDLRTVRQPRHLGCLRLAVVRRPLGHRYALLGGL